MPSSLSWWVDGVLGKPLLTLDGSQVRATKLSFNILRLPAVLTKTYRMTAVMDYRAHMTVAPPLDDLYARLSPRDDAGLTDTCAWEGQYPETCPANEYCAYIPSYWGCMPWNTTADAFDEDIPIATTCLDLTAYQTICPSTGCAAYTGWW